MAIIPNGYIPVAKGTNATLTARDIFVDDHVVVATAAITLTLPTPVAEYAKMGKGTILAANGGVTLSCTGGFVGGGNTKSISTTCLVEIEVVPVDGTGTSFKWAVNGEAANLAELTADQLLAVQGASSPGAANVFMTASAVGAPLITAASAKATPVDADYIGIVDTEAANVLKKTTWTQLKAFLKTYYDTIYQAVFTTDQAAAITGAASPSAGNVFATMADVTIPSPAGLGAAIAACSAKASPVAADSVAICDSAAANVGKETTIAELGAAVLAADPLGTAIVALAAKATPIDADSLAIVDSADNNDAKETTVAQLKAVLLSSANVGAAIAGYDAKATPIAADSVALCDSADTNAAKEVTVAQLGAVVLGADPLGTAIAALDAKASPIDADSIALCDSADTNDAKEVTIAQLRSALVGAAPLGDLAVALTAKTTPVDADIIILGDSADNDDAKKVTWANVKTTIGTADVATYSPTIGWAGGSPTVTGEVYRQKTMYDRCNWIADVSGTDGDDATTMTLTFDAARVPADIDAILPIKAMVSVAAGAFADVVCTLDCEDAVAGNRKVTLATGGLTGGQAFRIILCGEHEITPA